MKNSNIHDASGQLSGYLYQVLSALLLLLEHENPESKICIEKFDDVAFIDNELPQVMIQTKHQLYQQGNLNDTSVDLWRTIKSWCDYIKTKSAVIEETSFIILTTAHAKENTAAFYLKTASRDCKKALTLLQTAAIAKSVKDNEKRYDAFLSLETKTQEVLVNRIFIIDNAPTIADIQKRIMPYIRMVTIQPYEQAVYEKIVGWWIVNIIKCLYSEEPIFISYRQLQKKMYDIGSEYKVDSLPIDVNPYYEPTQEELDLLPTEKRVFIEQLNLIALSNSRLKRCIRDYYNAYQQRSRWVREQLLYINDLTDYENALVDEWERLFLIMQEKLEDYGVEVTEDIKQKFGKELFSKIEEMNIPIKKNVSDPFVMRGTYHELANQLKVGWHVDFMERLCTLLKE